MDTIKTAAAAVTGARHLRAARNGQDAASAWCDGDRGAIVVCDGCGAGGSSEVGARLGAKLVLAAIRARLDRDVTALWDGVRAEVGDALAEILRCMRGDPAALVHDYLLFTIVAAAWHGERVAVWAIGDGGYALGDREVELGPFADNQPPYLAYDLLGTPAESHLAVADATCGSVLVATDGAVELGLGAFADHRRYFANPDALRRHLATLARSPERIDWDCRRVERQPATLQDDGAVAILRWAP